jgi:hypothetical protein
VKWLCKGDELPPHWSRQEGPEELDFCPDCTKARDEMKS